MTLQHREHDFHNEHTGEMTPECPVFSFCFCPGWTLISILLPYLLDVVTKASLGTHEGSVVLKRDLKNE